MSETLYPPLINENGVDTFKRTSLALQELAVNRISQAMFSTPAERVYNFDKESDSQKKASNVIEEIYATQNNIDAENIERAKKLNASCQVVTIWAAKAGNTVIDDLTSAYELNHVSFSEIEGHKIWANIDDATGKLLVVSLEYKDSNDIDHFDIYVNGASPQLISYSKPKGWVLSESTEPNPKPLTVYPVVYGHLKKPVWGGDSGTLKVNQLEELTSYQGFYINKNAAPLFTRDMGDVDRMSDGNSSESASDSKKIVDVGKGGSVTPLTWESNPTAVDAQYKRIRNAFYEENQIPDTSFANMIASNTSADNKKIIFADATAKAIDLGGEWQKFFYDELIIVKKMIAIMFPSIATDLDLISIRSKITPYSVTSRKENAEYISIGGSAMSLETKIRILNEVDNVDEEVDLILGESSANANQLL
jgi:hypothetical protein